MVLAAAVVLGVVARLPAAQPDVGLLLVPREVLVARDPGAVVSDLQGGLLGDVLVGVCLDELLSTQATSVSAGGLRRQSMVSANALVPVGDVRLHAAEQGSVIAHVL